jgi:very-short-patch-repair endonuclease
MKDTKYQFFEAYCKSHGIPMPIREHKFHPTRKWRFDFAWPDQKIAIEVEGGLFLAGGGRHNRGASMKGDMEKYNEAACFGWSVLRYTPDQLVKSNIYIQIRTLFELRNVKAYLELDAQDVKLKHNP